MKVFGKELFNIKKEPGQMYDFAQHGILEPNYGPGVLTLATDAHFITNTPDITSGAKKLKKVKKVKEKILITPKGLYRTGALNDNKFSILTDRAYLDKQIDEVKEKLGLMAPKPKKSKRNDPDAFFHERGDEKYGRMELESILERLQNRSRLGEFKTMMEEYPHTTSALIEQVLKTHSHLRCQKAEAFVPDFPAEAIKAMKAYNEMCIALCNKKTVFYVIADSSDFEKKNKRRDPILLAQSPFGFFWQIIGAWDEEMVYLAEL